MSANSLETSLVRRIADLESRIKRLEVDAKSANALDDVADVSTPSVVDSHVLTYDQAARKWRARWVATRQNAGAPTDALYGAEVRDGLLCGDTTNTRLYLRLGGTWRYTALT